MAEALSNEIRIGHKHITTYILSVQTQAQEHDEITILARGRNVNKAVDVALIATERYLRQWEVGDVSLFSEDKAISSNHPSYRVSTISIVLQRI